MSTDSPEQCRQELSQLLQVQLSNIDEVNNYLVELKTSIAQNNIAAINDSLTQNSLPITDIEALDNHRNQLLIRYGFSADKDGQTACITWCDNNDGVLLNLYQSLTDSLIRLQRSIQVNDLLVSKGQDRIRRSVSLLTGQSNTDKSNTYSKSGQAGVAISKRSITLA